MRLEFGYGHTTQCVTLPEKNVLAVLRPKPHEEAAEDCVLRALRAPIGSKRLGEIVRPGEKIAIVTSDITRPLPAYKLLPALLDELYAAGIQKEDITIVFALGIHRRQTPEEMRALVGERAYSEVRCIDGDMNDCVKFGTTSRGTPVEIVRTVAEADRRICLGNIEYHYFAGYSGGGKAIMPGVSTHAAIQNNHSRMVEETACAGVLFKNPVREDIEEAAAMVGVDFIVNVVLDENKKIVGVFAGDVVAAHRAGCEALDRLYKARIPARADIVIASQGGAPKDLNLYQTQKALDNAKHAVKPGGIIILLGACDEGMGERVFEEWMTGAEDAKSMIARIKTDFQLGGHKAAAIAMVLENAEIFLVSNMEEAFVKSIFLTPYKSAQQALDEAFLRLGANATVLAMPFAGSTLPFL